MDMGYTVIGQAGPKRYVTIDKATNGWIVTVNVTLRAETPEQAERARADAERAAARHRERLAGEIKQQVAHMAVMGEALSQVNAQSVRDIDEEIEPWKKNAQGRKKKLKAEDVVDRADAVARKIVETIPLPEPHSCGPRFIDPIETHVFHDERKMLEFLAGLFSGTAS